MVTVKINLKQPKSSSHTEVITQLMKLCKKKVTHNTDTGSALQVFAMVIMIIIINIYYQSQILSDTILGLILISCFNLQHLLPPSLHIPLGLLPWYSNLNPGLFCEWSLWKYIVVSWEVVSNEEGISWPLNRPITELVSRGPLRISRKSWLASVEKFRN